jgi:pSer/pThr/pTyr-binding forkhead associated (FHA) protein
MAVFSHMYFDDQNKIVDDVEVKEGVPVDIGRDAHNRIVCYNATCLIASRRHATLAVTDGTLRIKDLGSRNGTYVCGELLPANTEVNLHVGDVVSFGSGVQLPGEIWNPYVFVVKDGPAQPDGAKNAVSAKPAISRDELDAFNLTCPACMDYYLNPVALVCGHSACEDCLKTWWGTSKCNSGRCPTCRTYSYASKQATTHYVLNELVEKIVEPCLTLEERTTRKRRLAVMENKRVALSKKRKRSPCRALDFDDPIEVC